MPNYFVKNRKTASRYAHSAMQCQWDTSMNAHEKILGCNADANYPDADPVATQFEYILCWYWCWFMYQIYVIVL